MSTNGGRWAITFCWMGEESMPKKEERKMTGRDGMSCPFKDRQGCPSRTGRDGMSCPFQGPAGMPFKDRQGCPSRTGRDALQGPAGMPFKDRQGWDELPFKDRHGWDELPFKDRHGWDELPSSFIQKDKQSEILKTG
uniref:Uncharacterized protein n=1 Tax=Globodera rostochiensis TaxID=31243 RepID=A0A914GV06_GLORO